MPHLSVLLPSLQLLPSIDWPLLISHLLIIVQITLL
jgi:hypothetical protein